MACSESRPDFAANGAGGGPAARQARPSVSIVVPVRDMAATMPQLVESLGRLDYPEDRREVIVVDNGSSDGSGRLAREAGLTVVDLPSPPSSYAARNAGIARAGGDWVAFTDADCVVDPGWLRPLVRHDSDPSVGAVAGEVVAFRPESTIARLMEHHGFMRHRVTMHHKALDGASTANLAVRRDVLANLGGFRGELRHFGDMDLCWRMQLELELELKYEPDAIVRHQHRRTWRALLRQGVAHGRGVAWMKRSYPEIYRFSGGEQAGRLAGMLASVARIPLRTGRPLRERLAEPLFLATWYGGMTAGWLMGPALTRQPDAPHQRVRRTAGEEERGVKRE
jgi:cellulose synthase/poly-beta-1,6-N-acetylglucosamine synthase-like glycosyltransferase